MTEANNIPAIDDDLNTTAPQEQPQNWKMPDPVFRRTSGKLPKGFEKNIDISNAPPDPGLIQAEPYASPEPKPSNPTVKIVLVVLGLLAMIAFIVVFLTVLYFFFWR